MQIRLILSTLLSTLKNKTIMTTLVEIVRPRELTCGCNLVIDAPIVHKIKVVHNDQFTVADIVKLLNTMTEYTVSVAFDTSSTLKIQNFDLAAALEHVKNYRFTVSARKIINTPSWELVHKLSFPCRPFRISSDRPCAGKTLLTHSIFNMRALQLIFGEGYLIESTRDCYNSPNCYTINAAVKMEQDTDGDNCFGDITWNVYIQRMHMETTLVEQEDQF